MAQFYSLTFPVCNSLAGGVLNVVVQLDRACFPRMRRESTTTHDNGGVPGVFVDD